MTLETIMKDLLEQQMTRTDKYRHDCVHCVKVLDMPIDMAFCSFKTFPKGVTTILQCPADCVNYFKEAPGE